MDLARARAMAAGLTEAHGPAVAAAYNEALRCFLPAFVPEHALPTTSDAAPSDATVHAPRAAIAAIVARLAMSADAPLPRVTAVCARVGLHVSEVRALGDGAELPSLATLTLGP